ncbi:DUF4007 domain-containing protein [Pseudoalteromonas rubra]|uniref:DUF4007 domain-containing protein n=1 Tax=Pseudoalteromonas rubra TaxID=43658 RepID=A0A5S3WUT4_9GAMM|nr:DUF4007 family protein [Pseudoalteromonas rubra]TMP32598.1 DUF4007 domain-containing protein [Pseudoalteromonas rubra]TMP34339.1 DUF4007 domain-containing protein [Pseudoalteromonas rubra]
MKLDNKKTAFGRHETFFLRYGWLTKGFWKYIAFLSKNDSNGDLFRSEQALVELGVGKNMVASIKYWLQATRLLEMKSNILQPTELGVNLIGAPKNHGWDPYLEDEGSLWLLHWLIASNSALATAFYWFFNCYHKNRFSQEELRTALSDFVKDNLSLSVSSTTIKNDIAVLSRMYSSDAVIKNINWDEALDSPLGQLGLVDALANKEYQSLPQSKSTLPAHVVGFAMAEIFNARNATSIPVEELIYSTGEWPALGAVFRLSENQAMALIEESIGLIPGLFEINESAGIHQVYKMDEQVDPMIYLEKYYSAEVEK